RRPARRWPHPAPHRTTHRVGCRDHHSVPLHPPRRRPRTRRVRIDDAATLTAGTGRDDQPAATTAAHCGAAHRPCPRTPLHPPVGRGAPLPVKRADRGRRTRHRHAKPRRVHRRHRHLKGTPCAATPPTHVRHSTRRALRLPAHPRP